MVSRKIVKNKVKRRTPSAKPKRMKNTSRAVSSIDATGRAFARLLADPCNAPMVGSTYSGMGTGEFRRFRQIIAIPATAVEGSYIFTPGTNALNFATHVAANAGTNYTFSNPQTLFAGLPTGTETRCLAACVKIRYIGPESARAGSLGLRTLPFTYTNLNQVSNTTLEFSLVPMINRLGEVMHEVKFLPGAGDENFSLNLDGNVGNLTTRQYGSFGFCFSGVPAGTLQMEVTGVLEIEAGGGLVPVACTPTSTNTTNQVLAALGPPARWAFSNFVVPTIKSAFNSVLQSSVTTGARSAGAMMLTL